MKEILKIKIKRINPEYSDIPLPSYATSGSSGMDLRAAIKDKMLIEAGKVAIIPTNLSVEIPEGYELQVRPRSGLAASYGIGVLNTPGTIDSDYRGEIKVIMMNFSNDHFMISRGDRIAQLVLSKVYFIELEEQSKLNNTARSAGGFGHTGLE